MLIREKKALFISFLLIATSFTLLGQDYKKQYKVAKRLFAEKNYSVAMNAFEPITVYHQDNPYFRHASFYYAIAAYYEGLFILAKDILLQLKMAYPSWTQQKEVSYWMSKIYFEQRQYFQGMNVLKECTGEEMEESVVSLKVRYLSQIKDIETIWMILEEHDGDMVIAQLLVNAIADSPYVDQYDQLCDSLCIRFNLNQGDSVTLLEWESIFKERYTVALLFPFLISNLEPTLAPKINERVLDLYRGITMAMDTLEKQEININLKLYDTQRSTVATDELLRGEDIKYSDLLVGPLFVEQVALVKQFSKNNQINMISPVSGNDTFLNENPYALLYLPSHKTVGMRSAEWLYENVTNKKCMVFFGDRAKDLATVNDFLERAQELGLTVIGLEQMSGQNASDILNILATPTDFDELGNPTEFELKRNSIGSVFVASDDPLIYTKVISGVDTRGDSTVILGNQRWLRDDMALFETYERLHVIMAAPNFYHSTNPEYEKFEQGFIKKYGAIPSEYAKTGYEFMLFIGNCLNQYGVYFQCGLEQQSFISGHMSGGYNYQGSQSNQLVPFISFKAGDLYFSHQN